MRVDERIEGRRRVFDPLYGYIYLSDYELQVIRSPLFNRLAYIRQLGLVSVLFPSATHTRLSHSLGVLHVAQKMISAVDRKRVDSDVELTPTDKALIRFSALLHDIGHLPGSHVGEQAYKSAFREKTNKNLEGMLGVSDKEATIEATPKPSSQDGFDSNELHESISASIIRNDRYINDALRSFNAKLPHLHRITTDQIAEMVTGKGEVLGPRSYLSRFVKSGLDADRLDFLSRDSYFVGSNYGRIETDVLIDKLRLQEIGDGAFELCLEESGAMIADHYLVSRFYWYALLLGHPRVLYLDSLFKDVMSQLIASKENDIMSADELRDIVTNIAAKSNGHKFIELQDAKIFLEMRRFHDKWDDDTNEDRHEHRTNAAIKVLMGGQLSHMFCRRLCIMPLSEYKAIFNDSEIESLERSAEEALWSEGLRRKSYVKAVYKAKEFQSFVPSRDKKRGDRFDPDWAGEVLIRCKVADYPKCIPFRLQNSSILSTLRNADATHERNPRASSSAQGLNASDKEKQNETLVAVNFAVFVVEPGSLTIDKKRVERVIEERFRTVLQKIEEKLHG